MEDGNGEMIRPETAGVSDAVLDGVAAEIRGFAAGAMLEFADTVGRIVLERFYGGDLERWRHHGPKDVSLRRLAERLGDETHFSASSLYRCVAIRLVVLRLGSVGECSNLSARHVTAVLPLPEADQVALLHEARASGWSARELERRVRDRHGRANSGRPATPALVRAIRHLERTVEQEVMKEIDRARALDRAVIEELHTTILRVREQLDRVQTQLSPKALGAVPVRAPSVAQPAIRPAHRTDLRRIARG